MTDDEIRDTFAELFCIFVRVEDGEVVFYSVDREPVTKIKSVDEMKRLLPLIGEKKPIVFDRSFDQMALMSGDMDIIEVCRVLKLLMLGDNFETRM